MAAVGAVAGGDGGGGSPRYSDAGGHRSTPPDLSSSLAVDSRPPPPDSVRQASSSGSLREMYRYFDLPFCSPEKVKEKSEALGEVLNGDRLVDAPYKLDFRVDHDSKPVCSKKLTKEDVAKFRNAVTKDYYFQMYYNDLPLLNFVMIR